MKLTKRFYIGANEVPLISHRAVIELSMAGRAVVEVKADNAKKGQLVALDIGYNEQLERWFSGYVTKATATGTGTVKMVIRELASILGNRWPISMQHATLRDVITKLADDTGLMFMLPDDVDYTDKPIANFTSQGTGYQLLTNAGRAFGINDFVWYQQQNGSIWLGSYAHSRWANRAVEIPAKWSMQQAGNCYQMAALPKMRAGALINGARVQKVELSGDDMVITWAQSAADRELKRRAMLNEFPELAGGYHLPRFGQVVGISDSANNGNIADPFRPRYAVDVQLLDENGQPDEAVPVYKAMPLPVMFAGPEAGLLQYPLDGTIVELGFAYGRPDKAFIRTVLGQDWSLPAIAQGEQLQQQRAEVYQRTDSAGNQTRATDQTQHDKAWAKHDTAEHYIADYGDSTENVAGQSAELIAGKKLIEALGAVDVLAGDDLSLGALGDLHITTAGQLIELVGKLRDIVIAQNDKLTILGDQITVVDGKSQLTVTKAIEILGQTIHMNGGAAVVTCNHICHFTGGPHGDGSSTVTAGK